MKSKSLYILFALVLAASMALAACQPEPVTVVETVVVTEVVEVEGETVVETQIVEVERVVTPEPEPMEEQPVTLDWVWTSEPPTLDPSLATDSVSIDVITNLFVGLTFQDEVGNVLPYLATEWEAGEDAEGNQTWTFMLRDDYPWVDYDPSTGEVTQVTDEEGNPRFVTAHDVVYGTKRTVDPETASNYAYVLYSIKNAQPINEGSEELTLDDLGVTALDDHTVQFTLEYPAAYFPAIASMWVLYPMPQWAIEDPDLGDRWTEAGVMQTNGPYALASWIHGGELDMIKNPLYPEADSVQIEYVEGVIINEESTAFALYENNEQDSVAVPSPELDRVRADPVLSEELYIAPDACTYYYGFVNNKAPFDDARVRRAFSASIDRQALVDNVLKGGQIPASSFAPPGIFGAPEPGTVGQGTDVELAQSELQSYLDEQGMTIEDFNNMDIVLMYNTSEGHARIAAAVQQMWSENLGVNVRVENQEWAVYLDTIEKSTPIEDAPHIFRLGWCADYADENNWVHEVFNASEGANRLRRGCTDPNCSGEPELTQFDELTIQAGREQDPDARVELYAQAEEILAGEEAAYAPIYHYTIVRVTKPWLDRNYPLIGGEDFFNWTIDWEAKQAATGG